MNLGYFFYTSIGGRARILIKKEFFIYMDITDEAGAISEIASLLAGEKINIKNIGKEVDSLEIAPFKIESGVYENGFELNFYGYFNKDGKKGDYASGEERVFVLPYLVFRSGLKEKNWENRYGLKCFLVTSLYPVEQKVMLN